MFVSEKGGNPLYVLEYHPRSAWSPEAAVLEASFTYRAPNAAAAESSCGQLRTTLDQESKGEH